MHATEQYARLLFDAMNTRELTELERHLAPDATFDFPGAGAITGSRRIGAFFKMLFRRYARLVFTVEDIILQDERACIVWANEGHTAAGQLYTNRGVTLLRIAEEKILSISDYFKDTSFVKEP